MDPTNIIFNAAILILSLALLDRFSYAVIKGASDISESTGIGYTSIGFIIVAFLTSLPEAVVSLFAAKEGASGIAIGNIFGSNIANVCIILGVPIVYGCLARREPGCGKLSLGKQEMSSLFFGLFISSTLPLILLRGTAYARYVGVILLGLFVVYSYHLAKSSFALQKPGDSHDDRVSRAFLKGAAWILIGIAGVIVSGYAVVYSGSNLAVAFSIPDTLVGATIVAFGTSLPELAISFKSVQKGRFDFALSNAVGSCFANLTVILGLFFIFSAVAVRVDAYFDLVFFSLVSNLFLWYFISRGKLGLKEGAVLILMYVAFLGEFVAGFRLF